MKKFLLPIALLYAVCSYGQSWQKQKFDDNLTISIPDNYVLIDTLGQHFMKAVLNNAIILVQRMPNSGSYATPVHSKEQLKETYLGYQAGVIKSQNGNLVRQQWIEQDGFLLTRFVYSAMAGEEKQLRHCVTILLNDNWYSVNFWEVEALSSSLTTERETLFSSLRLPIGQGLENQMSKATEGTGAYKFGYRTGQLLVLMMVASVVVGIIYLITRKKKRQPL
jgi:hypothetical protein